MLEPVTRDLEPHRMTCGVFRRTRVYGDHWHYAVPPHTWHVAKIAGRLKMVSRQYQFGVPVFIIKPLVIVARNLDCEAA